MYLRIKFFNQQRPGRNKLLKSLYPNAHAYVRDLAMLYNLLGEFIFVCPLRQQIKGVAKRPFNSSANSKT